jgi:16S rRNA (guanine527-N7)-methyltransferase
METARMAELLRPFLEGSTLSPAQIGALQTYLSLLLRWNARTNLTAVRDEIHIVTRHIGESLFAARHLLDYPTANISVIDVGSGAGFPGLPMKVYAPQIDLTLVEAQNKKVTFLREVIRALRLEHAQVFAGRAETFEGKADLVTMRAVEKFEKTIQVAATLVRPDPDARLALLIGKAQVGEASRLLPDFRWSAPLHIPFSSARAVFVGTR